MNKYNFELENYFVDKCIVKEKKDRIRYELTNLKKRNRCIDRFSHNCKSFLVNDCLETNSIDECISLIKKNVKNQEMYCVSMYDLVPQTAKIEDIKSYFETTSSPLIVISHNVIIIKEEFEYRFVAYVFVFNVK